MHTSTPSGCHNLRKQFDSFRYDRFTFKQFKCNSINSLIQYFNKTVQKDYFENCSTPDGVDCVCFRSDCWCALCYWLAEAKRRIVDDFPVGFSKERNRDSPAACGTGARAEIWRCVTRLRVRIGPWIQWIGMTGQSIRRKSVWKGEKGWAFSGRKFVKVHSEDREKIQWKRHLPPRRGKN